MNDGLTKSRADAGLTPKACPDPCPCPCHGDDENPGPHLSVCALIDPDVEPDEPPLFVIDGPPRYFDDPIAKPRRVSFDPVEAMTGKKREP